MGIFAVMVKMQKKTPIICEYIQNRFYIIMHKINALRLAAEGDWREYVGIEPTREVTSPPHRF